MGELKTLSGFVVATRQKGESGALGLILPQDGSETWILAPRGNKVGGKGTILGAYLGILASFECGRTNPNDVWLLHAVKPLRNYGNISADLAFNAYLMFAGEWLEKFFQEDSSGIYPAYERALAKAGKGQVLAASLLFSAFALKALGIQPDTSACVSCGAIADLVAFSFTEGGFVCRQCATQLGLTPLPRKQLLTYKYLFATDLAREEIEKIDPVVSKRVLGEILAYVEDYFQTKLESAPLLAQSLS